jgi:2-amino-4-hydroxy-6-hydroxymethyldihydropteridine diphosphokinase
MIAAPAVVGLGGNVGDVVAAFRRALQSLDATDGVRVISVSSLLRTEPVGGPEQDDFLNAAALLAVEPVELLAVMQALEVAAERVRAERWGPRTLDLDLLWWADKSIESAALSVPHPRLMERRFALQPLVEVAPSALTGDGRRYADILSTLPSEGVEVIGGPSLVYDPTSTDNGGSESCRT